ncbi:MAG: pyridoxamine kinase [Oscillospiraceae bacterium]
MGNKKALCIHDMSSVGRCSLTVISPVLSVMGVQCVPLATAVLSTHFGGFGQVASRDLTEFCHESLKQFERIGVKFDCVYSGYLASPPQMEIVKMAFEQNKSALKVCDPVMADNGKLYSSFTQQLSSVLGEICAVSDIITPNPTEANILLGKDYDKTVFCPHEIKQMVMGLNKKYKNSVVITGAKLEDKRVICAGFNEKTKEYFTIECNYIPVHFPGTGDLFCAVLTGCLLKDDDLPAACKKAAEFVEKCVKATYNEGVDTRFGVELEPQLKYLLE